MRRRRRTATANTGSFPRTRVLVRDASGHPLAPCAPARARALLKRGRAWLLRERPPVIQLADPTARPETACRAGGEHQ